MMFNSNQENAMLSTRLRAVRAVVLRTAAVSLALGGLVALPGGASAALLPGPAPVEQRPLSAVTADVLPTVQIDRGVVWTQEVVGNTVYAGGSFTNARPAGAAAGTNLIPRTNLLAYDIRTGVLVPSFAPTFNGQVKVVRKSPDGTRIYVGGQFTTANGQTRYNLAAYSTATGELLTTFKPAVGGSYVNAIAVTDTAVYVGGLIGAGAGVARKNFAAFNLNGKLLAWAPTSDLQVDAMVLTPKKDKLIVGGRFSTVNGVSQRGLAALDLVNGALLPWAAPQTVINGYNQAPYAGKAGIYSLSADATSIYGTGWVYANTTVGNLEGTFSADPDTGNIKWVADCHGDTYTSYSDNTTIYTTSHNHDCQTLGGYPQASPVPGNLRHAQAMTTAAKGTLTRSPSAGATYKDWSGTPAPAVVDWFPDWVTGSFTGQGQAGWTATGNGDYLLIGGEFPYVNGTLQQGLVRFARPGIAPSKQGPRLSGDRWIPTAVSVKASTVRLSIPANWDRDDLNLDYEVFRNGTAGPIGTLSSASKFWDQPMLSFSDTGLTAGQTYSYHFEAVDPSGNRAKSNTVPVTVTSEQPSAYANAVLNDGASTYWRLGGAAGTPAYDWAGANDGVVGAGVTPAGSGALPSEPANRASAFSGTTTGLVTTPSTANVGPAFSLELWMRTTTTTGGKLIGFGSSKTGASGSYDRHVYMSNDGRLTFGVYPGAVRSVTGAKAYNDGKWHHVVAAQSAAGIVLTVDGTVVGNDPSVTSAQQYSGYWRVGGDNTNGWPNRGSSDYFAGDIDEVAIYPAALSLAQVQDHYINSVTTNAPPVAAFTSTSSVLGAAFDGSGSSDTDGTVASYAWDFGDGTAKGSGATPSHPYAAAGTYTVVLTVTDNKGATASVSHPVTVTGPPNQSPTASFTSTTTDLSVSLDATASTDPDGTIASYAWNFGDSTATGSGPQPVHLYATAGTYQVTLTVTDNSGSTNTVTHPVTVSAPPANSVIASDDFNRTVVSGWGVAVAGGTWNTIPGFSVSGGAGRILLSAAGQTRANSLATVSARDVDALASVSLDKIANGGGVHFNYRVRQATDGDYRMKLRVSSTGVVMASIAKLVGPTETLLSNKTLPGVTLAPGQSLTVRLQAVSAGASTTLRAKVWDTSQPEPAAWLLTNTDSQVELQRAGAVVVSSYLTSTSTNAPVTVSVDNLAVVKP